MTILVCALLALLAYVWFSNAGNRWYKVFRMRRRFKRAARAEDKARDYLEAHGLRVLEEQQSIKPTILIDGVPHEYSVRIDYVVASKNRTFGVEVKTGKSAINPSESATRRQLLEYAQVYNFDGLYLLDMETPRLMEIKFPGYSPARQAQWDWPSLVSWGFILGFVFALAIR